MWAILTSLLGGYWKWILGALVALGIGVSVWAHFKHVHDLETEVLTLNSELSTAVKANADMKADYAKSIADQKAAYEQRLREKDEAAKESAKHDKVNHDIDSAPASDDGLISPVLRRAIDSMWAN